MNPILIFFCSLLLVCPLIAEDEKATAASEGKSNQPNIILFFTDDHGWRDSELYGNPYIKTPNITRLASGGGSVRPGATDTPKASGTSTGRMKKKTESWHRVDER